MLHVVEYFNVSRNDTFQYRARASSYLWYSIVIMSLFRTVSETFTVI